MDNNQANEQKKEKKLYCPECETNITDSDRDFLICDKCGNAMCEGHDSGSCWHNHLQQVHGIDWSIGSTLTEEFIEELTEEKGEIRD